MVLKKTIFANTSTSYSQFLSSNYQTRCLKKYSDSFVNIEFFKRSIASHYRRAYRSQKEKNLFYRLIFFGFSILFLIFSIFIYFKTPNFAYGLYFGHGELVKDFIEGCCLFIAGLAFTIGYKIQSQNKVTLLVDQKIFKDFSPPKNSLSIRFNMFFKNFLNEWLSGNPTYWINKN